MALRWKKSRRKADDNMEFPLKPDELQILKKIPQTTGRSFVAALNFSARKDYGLRGSSDPTCERLLVRAGF